MSAEDSPIVLVRIFPMLLAMDPAPEMEPAADRKYEVFSEKLDATVRAPVRDRKNDDFSASVEADESEPVGVRKNESLLAGLDEEESVLVRDLKSVFCSARVVAEPIDALRCSVFPVKRLLLIAMKPVSVLR